MRYRLLFICLLATSAICAQIPSGYYNNAYNKKGRALRTALYNIVKNHTSLSYNALWDAYETTDRRPDNGKVWDIYSDRPNGSPAYYYTFGSDQCGSYNGEGDCYNREHSVPKSWFGDASPMYTDLFHLYPTDGFVNGKRSNMPFGEVSNATWTSTNGSKVGSCSTSGYSGTVFEPIDAYKGDLARSYFYFTVCYMDKNLGQTSESMFTNGNLDSWALKMLIRWHEQDPVSQKEIDRNNAIYSIQGNRNPFIDYPELVGKIYGSDSVNVFNPNSIETYALEQNWLVFPNPTTNIIHIIPPIELEEAINIQVLNLAGQVVWQETSSSADDCIVDLSSLTAGMYLINIQSDNFRILKKIVKK